MATRRVLIDTSVIIDHFRKQNKENTFLWKLLNSDDELCISVITEFEFYCECKTLQRKNEAREVLDAFSKFVFDSFHSSRASEIYSELRAKNQLIDILDGHRVLTAGIAGDVKMHDGFPISRLVGAKTFWQGLE